MLFNGIWGGESVAAEAGRWEYESVHRRADYLRGRRITEWTWKITRTEWKWNYCIWRSQQLFCTPTITKKKKRKSWFTSNNFLVWRSNSGFLLQRTATQTEASENLNVPSIKQETWLRFSSLPILGHFTWLFVKKKTCSSFTKFTKLVEKIILVAQRWNT